MRNFAVNLAGLAALCHIVGSIDPELLKPCFERYDGYKLFGASPIHSEWRMNNEKDCLPFCIRASSRCASIVYDKSEKTCYYFSVSGIELESIERNRNTVYLQVSERRCVDDMLMAMESENADSRHVTVSLTKDVAEKDRRYILQRYPNAREHNPPPKLVYSKTETEVNVAAVDTVVRPVMTETVTADTTTTPTVPPLITTTVSADADKIYDDSEAIYGTPRTVAIEKISPTAQSLATVPTTATVVNSHLSKYTRPPNSIDGDTETTNSDDKSVRPTDASNVLPSFPPSLMGLGSAMDSMPSLLPVMSVFKAQRRPSPVTPEASESAATEHVDFNISNEIRRHPPSRLSPPTNATAWAEPPTTVRPSTVAGRRPAEAPVASFSRDDAPETARAVPRVERLPPPTTSSAEVEESIDDEKIAGGREPVPGDGAAACDASMRNEIWLAVESAKLKSSLRARNMNYLEPRQPQDCMRDCSQGKDGRRRCDAFTYLEATRQCVFDTVGRAFLQRMAAPAPRADYSTRAFHRLCFPTNMARFRGCAEFLAFRNYALNIPARELFNGLPAGTEGVAACVELCVLSSDFQCRSGLFDEKAGVCQLFDEHSLSAPLAFKEHGRTGALYFENGCLDGGEVPQVGSLGSSLQRSQTSASLGESPRR